MASGGGKLMSVVGEAQTFPLSIEKAMHILGSAATMQGQTMGKAGTGRPRRQSRAVVPST